MSHVELKHGKDARDSILKGAEQLAKSVTSTLGPWGRNACIRRNPVFIDKQGTIAHRPPLITKDGVSVAQRITSLPDPFEDMGVQIVKEAAQRTNSFAGDGTTSATLLAYYIMEKGAEAVNDGANAIHLRRGMQKACDAVCEELETMKKDVSTIEEIKAVATISSQDEEIGSLVAMVVDEVGKDGSITMQNSNSVGITYEVTDGMQIPSGFITPHLSKSGMALIEDPYVLVTTEAITSIRTMGPILSKITDQLLAAEEVDTSGVVEDGRLKLVIFSSGFTGDALSTLVKNHVDHPEKFQFLILQPPHYGARQIEVLEDIAAVTGASLIEKTLGRRVEDMSLDDLGTCKSVIASGNASTVVGSHGGKDEVKERVDHVKERLETEQDNAEIDYLRSRLAGLTGKVASILIGGSSTTEQREKHDRVEDAVASTRAAHETGILPGGGVAFLRCHSAGEVVGNGDELKGAKIIETALSQQMWWVAKNAGEDPQDVINKVLKMKDSEGFNANTGEYGDMYEMKVVDPTRVPVTALINAVSVAGAFITTEVAIIDTK